MSTPNRPPEQPAKLTPDEARAQMERVVRAWKVRRRGSYGCWHWLRLGPWWDPTLVSCDDCSAEWDVPMRRDAA